MVTCRFRLLILCLWDRAKPSEPKVQPPSSAVDIRSRCSRKPMRRWRTLMTSMGNRKKATVETRMIRWYIQVGLTTAEEKRRSGG